MKQIDSVRSVKRLSRSSGAEHGHNRLTRHAMAVVAALEPIPFSLKRSRHERRSWRTLVG